MQEVIVLDFGGQYNQLIARRVRECSVYCEVKPYTTPLSEIKARHPIGIIFTGGPNSVYDPASPQADPEIFRLGVPILGICYGCQLLAHHLGGRVVPASDASAREYGKTETFYDPLPAVQGSAGAGRLLDEPRRLYGEGARRLCSDGPLRGLSQRGHRRRRAGSLRRTVPPRGQPHGARRADDPQLPL
jgi:hypothetical protein